MLAKGRGEAIAKFPKNKRMELLRLVINPEKHMNWAGRLDDFGKTVRFDEGTELAV